MKRYILIIGGIVLIAIVAAVLFVTSYFTHPLFASPTVGTAPFEVQFSVRSLDFLSTNGGVSIDFGDGSSTAVCGPGMCQSKSHTHLYITPGKYEAQLVVTDYDNHGNFSVLGDKITRILGKTTIVVH